MRNTKQKTSYVSSFRRPPLNLAQNQKQVGGELETFLKSAIEDLDLAFEALKTQDRVFLSGLVCQSRNLARQTLEALGGER